MEGWRICYNLGTYHTDDMDQKYYTQYELDNYLQKAGLKKTKFDRIIYPKKFSYNYQGYNQGPAMWDWFFQGEKI